MGMQGQIIAIGGGGFSSGSEPELDEYVLRQSGVAKPKIGFIATASGDADAYLLKFYSRFRRWNAYLRTCRYFSARHILPTGLRCRM